MDGCWITLAEQDIKDKQSVFKFWSGLNVWIDRPHLLNRKLLSNEILHVFPMPCLKGKPHVDFNKGNLEHFVNDVFANQEIDQKAGNDQQLIDSWDIEFVLRKLIPRDMNKFTEVMELLIKDKKNNAVIFWPKESDVLKSRVTPAFPYRIKLNDTRIILETYRNSLKPDATEQASKEWLKATVLPKLINWSCCSPNADMLTSLKLISPKRYSINYNKLKEKYGKKYVQIWPENSDPLKYVYEDIGIAAYLMTLWEIEREDLNLSKQSFVDLGCGNGLLVDILASEGYMGIGIDVRKRKIWDLYEKHTTLIEKAIEPSDYHIFPDYDWIIGNHSDELTPWIPVIAARSSYKMKVFLLPCCAYTFNGKYSRCSQGKTQYQSYLTFIHSLCESMGFIVQKDKLRIPSTKRICFVCTSRNYKEEDEKNIDLKRKEIIESHCKKAEPPSCTLSCKSIGLSESNQNSLSENLNLAKETNWIDNFKPREQVELVRNCSQLNREFLDKTVLLVANLLLETDNYITLQRGSETISWNSGGKLKFKDLIESLDPNILKSMKNQCGGFQTFLRNHRNVFQIIDGFVHLTVPVKGIPLNSKPVKKRKQHAKKQYNFQEKPCFFYFHHPQGCPLETSDCKFSHKMT